MASQIAGPSIVVNPVVSPAILNATAAKLSSPIRWSPSGAGGLWDLSAGTQYVSSVPHGFDVAREARRIVHAANDVIVYQLVTDRYRQGAPHKRHLPHVDRSRKNYYKYFGGDFAGITSALSFIRSLGATAIWMSPIHANAQGMSGREHMSSYHGYWVEDWFRLNEHFTSSGQREALSGIVSLVEAARAHGLEMYFDAVIHHGPPVSTKSRAAIYRDGQFITDYDKDVEVASGEFHDAGSDYFPKGDVTPPNPRQAYLHYPEITHWGKPYPGELTDASLLDLATINPTNPDITGMIFEAYRDLFEITGALGVRIDAMKHLRSDYARKFVEMLMHLNPLIRVVGEYFNASLYNHEGDGCVRLSDETGMSFFDFGLQYLIHSAFKDPTALYMDYGDKRRCDPRYPLLIQIADYIRKMSMSPALFNYALRSYIWLDNHDLPRFLNADKDDVNAFRERHRVVNPEHHAQDQALLLLTMMPGRIVLYYGQEQYLKGPNRAGFWGPASDPYNRPWYGDIPPDDHPGVVWMRKLTGLRHKNPALTSGSIELIDGQREDILSFKRTFVGNEVFYWHNRGHGYAGEFRVRINWPDGTYADPVTGGEYSVKGGVLTIPSISRRQKTKDAMDIDYRTVVLTLNSEQ